MKQNLLMKITLIHIAKISSIWTTRSMWSISSINTMSSNFTSFVSLRACSAQSELFFHLLLKNTMQRAHKVAYPKFVSFRWTYFLDVIINVMYSVSSELSSLIHVLQVHPLAFASIILSTFIHLNEIERYLMHPYGLLSSSTWTISLQLIKGHAYLIHTISFIMSWISSVCP